MPTFNLQVYFESVGFSLTEHFFKLVFGDNVFETIHGLTVEVMVKDEKRYQNEKDKAHYEISSRLAGFLLNILEIVLTNIVIHVFHIAKIKQTEEQKSMKDLEK